MYCRILVNTLETEEARQRLVTRWSSARQAEERVDTHDKTRQYETKQDKIKQDNATQLDARKDKTRQENARQDMT
jgi:hypothetical protein